jgi:ABC-type hemin transport system substrate-binding protein
MDTSNINPAEELAEIQLTSGHPLAGEPILHMEPHPQIEVDLPCGPAIVSRTSTSMYKD